MKILHCPLNGPKNIDEFQYLGPVKPQEPEMPEEIIERLFLTPNPAGTVVEWWRHTPSNTIFLAERNTLTDIVTRTWLPNQPAGV